MTEKDRKIEDLEHSIIKNLITSNQDAQSIHNVKIYEILTRIEAQTTKTNGRVTALENWKWKAIGIYLGSSAVVGGIIILIGIIKK